MRDNQVLTHGAPFSQRVLLALVEQGRSRDEAYRIAQRAAQRAWDERIQPRELLEQGDLDTIFDLGHFTRHARAIVDRLGAARL